MTQLCTGASRALAFDRSHSNLRSRLPVSSCRFDLTPGLQGGSVAKGRTSIYSKVRSVAAMIERLAILVGMAISKIRKKSKVQRRQSTGLASNSVRKQPGAARRLHAQGVQTIESVLGKGKDPVLGLYLHTVHILMIKGLGRNPRFRSIMPHLIGTPSILSKHPGLSQIELAAFLGTERATAGLQVAQCLKHGFVRRALSKHDRRRYELFVTPKGLRLLADARDVIPEHENLFAGSLTSSERNTLRRLLLRLISG